MISRTKSLVKIIPKNILPLTARNKTKGNKKYTWEI